MGIITPVWYFAPQKNEIAEIGWETLGQFYGVLNEGNITGLDDPVKATMLLHLAGEFCDHNTKKRLWDAAEEFIEPIWDRSSGELTLGLRLNERFPRGQWNARIMAGWVCQKGDWSRIFNEPNLNKFSEPTIEGVDFPDFALSEARWTGVEMYLRVDTKNKDLVSTKTTMKMTNLKSLQNWVLISKKSGKKRRLESQNNSLPLEISATDGQVVISQEI